MIPFVNLPVKIVKLFTSNVSVSEIAAGVCMGMFFGFIPLDGPMALLLFILFFLFRINRLATMLVLPVFKAIYFLGGYLLADKIGGFLLIKLEFLKPLWEFLLSLPVIAFLDLGNTLVTGGLALSFILMIPVYPGAKKGVAVLRERYFGRIRDSRIARWFVKLPLVGKIISIAGKTGGGRY